MLGFNSWFGVYGLIVGWDGCEFGFECGSAV